MKNRNVIFIFQTECSAKLKLTSYGLKGEPKHEILRYLGSYRNSFERFEDHYIYKKYGNDSFTSYLFYNFGSGWRVSVIDIIKRKICVANFTQVFG